MPYDGLLLHKRRRAYRHLQKEGLTISEVMLRRQQELSDDTAENILKELKTTLHAMKRSVEEGLTEELESVSGLYTGAHKTVILKLRLGHLSCRVGNEITGIQ